MNLLIFLLPLAAFLAWTLIGVAALTIFRVDTRELRLVLVAPALGTALCLLPLFVVSSAGVGLGPIAFPFFFLLVAAAVVVVSLRRPAVRGWAVAVLCVCVVALV